jgi:hypothetical protein
MIFVIIFCFFSTAFAEKDIGVRMLVEPSVAGVGDPFTVTVEITSSESVDIEPVTAPTIQGAQFLGMSEGKRINSSTGMNAQGKLEFKTVQTKLFTFQYAGTTEGVLVVPAPIVNVDGAARRVSSAKISIVKESQISKTQRARQRGNPLDDNENFGGDPFENIDKMEDAFNRLLQRQFGGGTGVPGFQAVPPINAQDAFVIVAEVDKTNVYKGEQITATWYLYTKAGVREIDTLKYPTLKGFWKEDIELATLLTFQPAELEGKPYNKALLASYALFPIEAGKATVDAYRAKVVVVGGFGRAMTSTKSSQSIPILVKPLPEVSQQAVFSGAVGEFQMNSKIESLSVVAHQPFSLKVRVDGRGNAKQFELPNMDLPPSVELYDIKKDSQFFKNGTSYKEFEIFLIPREQGPVTIPAISTTVFNPKTEKYETLTTQPFEIQVLAGTGQQGIASNRIQKDEQKPIEPLVPIATWTPSSSSQWVPNISVFTVLFATSGLFFLVSGFWMAGVFAKDETLKEKFLRRHKKLKTLQSKKKWRELGVEATNLVNFVLGDVIGEGGADVHIDRLLDKLPPSVRKEMAADLKPMMNRFYVLGFGPDEAVQQTVAKDDFSKDIQLLDKLMLKAIEMSSLS